MELVVDVNVVLSALVKRGVSFKVFALNRVLRKFKFFAPDFMLSEFVKHRDRILKESGLREEVFLAMVDLIFSQIEIVPSEAFGNFVPKAMELLEDEKDVPYVALALAFNCPIFSGDSDLREIEGLRYILQGSCWIYCLGREENKTGSGLGKSLSPFSKTSLPWEVRE